MNEYEKEYTAPFEGAYTEEEVALNQQLYRECSKEHPDWSIVENLLQKGADPLGATAVEGWGLLEHVYNELAFESHFSKSVNLPRITELFLQYGMDVEKPRVPYDNENSLHPLWSFSFLMNGNAIVALKMLLDHGLSGDGVAEMWDHVMMDLYHIESGNPNDGGEWNYFCTWMMKILMLCVSYDHVILWNEGSFRTVIDYACNLPYDLHKFRNWDNFDYQFDTSYGRGEPDMCYTIVRIFEKETHREVWKIAMWNEGKKVLQEELQKVKALNK